MLVTMKSGWFAVGSENQREREIDHEGEDQMSSGAMRTTISEMDNVS